MTFCWFLSRGEAFDVCKNKLVHYYGLIMNLVWWKNCVSTRQDKWDIRCYPDPQARLTILITPALLTKNILKNNFFLQWNKVNGFQTNIDRFMRKVLIKRLALKRVSWDDEFQITNWCKSFSLSWCVLNAFRAC